MQHALTPPPSLGMSLKFIPPLPGEWTVETAAVKMLSYIKISEAPTEFGRLNPI